MEGSLVAYKVFSNGSVLNASEINENLMNQSVMVFSNSTARAAALTSPVEGMLTWLEDVNRYENYDGTAWVELGSSKILQVVSGTKTDAFSASVAFGATTAITGLTATITPTSAANNILVFFTINSSNSSASNNNFIYLKRDSTVIGLGDAAGNRKRVTSAIGNGIAVLVSSGSGLFLDSPNTTSSITYGFDIGHSAGSTNTILVNRSNTDTDNAGFARTISTITLMEVAA
jgi:hypothetical protein